MYGNAGKDSCLRGIATTPFGRLNPDGLKWVIVSHHREEYLGGCKVVATTDVPVLLFAYVSPYPPKKKRGTHTKRGVVFHHSAKVNWRIKDIVCQEEKGWDVTHSFTLGCYEDEDELWWRYGGRTSKWTLPFTPIWSASKSGFYHWNCMPLPIGPCCGTDLGDTRANKVRGGEFGIGHVIPRTCVVNTCTFPLTSRTVYWPLPQHIYFRIYTLNLLGYPSDPPIVEKEMSPEDYHPDFPGPQRFIFPPVTLNEGQKYYFSFGLSYHPGEELSRIVVWEGENDLCQNSQPFVHRWWVNDEPGLWSGPGGISHYLLENL